MQLEILDGLFARAMQSQSEAQIMMEEYPPGSLGYQVAELTYRVAVLKTELTKHPLVRIVARVTAHARRLLTVVR